MNGAGERRAEEENDFSEIITFLDSKYWAFKTEYPLEYENDIVVIPGDD